MDGLLLNRLNLQSIQFLVEHLQGWRGGEERSSYQWLMRLTSALQQGVVSQCCAPHAVFPLRTYTQYPAQLIPPPPAVTWDPHYTPSILQQPHLTQIHDHTLMDLLPQVGAEDLDQGDLECGDLTVHEDPGQVQLNLEANIDLGGGGGVRETDSIVHSSCQELQNLEPCHSSLHSCYPMLSFAYMQGCTKWRWLRSLDYPFPPLVAHIGTVDGR